MIEPPVADGPAPIVACPRCDGATRETVWDGEVGAWMLPCGHGLLYPGDAEATMTDEEHSCSQCGWSGTGFHACPGVPGENEW